LFDLQFHLQRACFFDRCVFVGDVVLLKDPQKSDNYLVRRLAATEGYEMVSKDEKDEPFVLEKDQCWVLADNENIKPKVDGTFLFSNLIIIFRQIVWCVTGLSYFSFYMLWISEKQIS
jgi:hypothetical protein